MGEEGPSSSRAVGVDNTARRKFDLEEFRAQAAKRELEEEELDGLTPLEVKKLKRIKRDPLHNGVIARRDNLQGRDYKLDLASRLNKTQVISTNTPLNQQAGYYCEVCDCILRDSQSYLDHINGKYHNRALGMSMRVERKGLTDVQKRLELHREKKAKEKREDYVPDGFEKRVQDIEERERKLAQERRERKKEKKLKAKEQLAITEGREQDDTEAEMAAMLGFTGFGGGK